MPVRIRVALLYVAIVLGAGCGGSKAASTTPDPDTHPLAGISGQNIIIAPVQALRMPADVGWPALPPAKPTLARLDSIFADTLTERVGNRGWVYADGVIKAAANNPTYATDPRGLAVNSLRATTLKLGDRLVEPLASQLRTMIALHDARLVLVPVDLTIERTAAGPARPTLHLVLVDPRSSVVRWIGQVTGNDSPAFTSDIPALIATRLADLFASR